MLATHPVNRAVLFRWVVPLDLQGQSRGFTAGTQEGGVHSNGRAHPSKRYYSTMLVLGINTKKCKIDLWLRLRTYSCIVKCGRGEEGSVLPHRERSKQGAVLHSYPGCMLVAMGERREEYWCMGLQILASQQPGVLSQRTLLLPPFL